MRREGTVHRRPPVTATRSGGSRASVVGVALVALTLLPILAVLGSPPALAQDGTTGGPGSVDLTLRPPAQTVFVIGDDARPYGTSNVEAFAGDQIEATMELRVFRRSNQLTDNVTWQVAWELERSDSPPVTLAATNGSFGPDAPNRSPVTLNATLPTDLDDGAYTFRFTLVTGSYDPNLDNNDPEPIGVRIGALQYVEREGATGWRAWGGALAFATLVGTMVVAGRAHAVTTGLAKVHDLAAPLRAWRDAFLQRPRPARRWFLQSRAAALFIVLGAVATIAHGGLTAGGTGLVEIAVLGAVTSGVALGAHALRTRRAGEPTPADLRALVGPGLLVVGVAFAWQQASGVVEVLRWPSLLDLGPFVVIGLSIGALYALIALGYTMVYGILKFINFAHGEVFLWGGYLTWMFVVMFPVFPVWVAIPIAAVLTALMGAGIERVAYRPLRGGNRLAPLITAIAVSLLLSALAQFAFGVRSVSFASAGSTYLGSDLQAWLSSGVHVLGTTIDRLAIMSAAISVLILVGLQAFIARSRTGRAIRAIADDMETARIVGIDVDRMIMITFMIGSAVAAVGGALYGMRFTLSPTSGLLVGITAFTAAVIGGIGNIYGSFLGAILIGLINNVGGQFIDSRFHNVITFGVLILFLLFRPQGILGDEKGVGRR